MLWIIRYVINYIVIYWSSTYSTVYAVPPEYCLQPLNTSDCKGAPTSVFYYYKPGSRCEMGIWKGCPTYNKFEDEYLCSHHCVFRFIKPRPDDAFVDTSKDQCYKPVTENKCKDKKQSIAYTYEDENQDCVPIVWGECSYPNIFKDKQTCVNVCVTDWTEDVKKLNEEEVKELDKLLVDYLAPDGNKPLKMTEGLNVTQLMSNTTEEQVTEAMNVTEVTMEATRTRGIPETPRSVELPP